MPDTTLRHLSRTLVVSDTHAPCHSKRAWACMLAAAREYDPDRIVIIGDFVNCESVTPHEPSDDEGVSRLKDELVVANRMLDQLDELECAEKVYIEGNHELWLRKYLARRAPALNGIVSLRKLLRLRHRGWKWVPYHSSYQIGDPQRGGVLLKHDAGGAGAYAHARAVQRTFGSVVIGHTHRLGEHRCGPYVGVACGHLSGAKASRYAHDVQRRCEWTQGFATIDTWHDGTSTVRTHEIRRSGGVTWTTVDGVRVEV